MRSTLVLLALALPAAADDKKTDDLEKKALDIVKQVGDLHKNAKTMHTEVQVVSEIDDGSGKKQVKSTATHDLQRPKHFAMRTRVDGDAQAGPDLISDGKKVFVHAKKQKQYTEDDCLDIADLTTTILPLGMPFTGMLFQNVLGEDPEKALMEGVTACSYAGKEKVNGTEAHHLKFEQPGLKWELWVAAEGQPFVLKAHSALDANDRKITTTETYQNWKVDVPPSKEAFTFTPGNDAKKVQSIDPGTT